MKEKEKRKISVSSGDSEEEEEKKKKRRKKNRKRSESSNRTSSSESSRSRSRSRHKKHKKGHKKRRSRTPKRKRSRTPKKRERSSAKDKREEFRFDSPPKEHAALPKAALPTAEMLYTMYGTDINPNEMSKRILMLNQVQQAQTAKSDRKLYIGNLPPNMTPELLTEYLNQSLRKLHGYQDSAMNPIVGSWVAQDGKYGFIEFRSSEEADKGFELNKVELLGYRLKVGRPKTYNLGKISGTDGELGGNAAVGPSENEVLTMKMKYTPPTTVLVFKNMVTENELTTDEEYKEILDDIQFEIEKYVRLVSIKIPRPDEEGGGIGKVFAEFSLVDDAKQVRRELNGKLFSKKTVDISYYPKEKYHEGQFGEPDFTIVTD